MRYTIFRPPPRKLENMKLPSNKNQVNYDGLGGSTKDDIFPSPKPAQTGLKRHKSSSVISSSKFRKLAPTAKVTDFLNSSNSCHQ
ncbi:hypothetical protein NQ314_008232 [Rhamnusium bicolor]|uniref:Uncharacterized protein n=1 Tax=Rhamnusium bicolor TaxID=1586634 RepID=A0AAV8YFU7_9CUCU|nr:hypothetical protein NQ314_008232 [Rhamnusium bicolor]